jgi:hypothetical protein
MIMMFIIMMMFITLKGLRPKGQLTNIIYFSLTNSINAFEPLRYTCPCSVSYALKYMIIDECCRCCSVSQGLFLKCLASLIQRLKLYYCVCVQGALVCRENEM